MKLLRWLDQNIWQHLVNTMAADNSPGHQQLCYWLHRIMGHCFPWGLIWRICSSCVKKWRQNLGTFWCSFKMIQYVKCECRWRPVANIIQDGVIKWKHFPHYWPFVQGIPRSPVNSPHKGQWCGAFMFSLICAWINSWVNNREAGDLRRHRILYHVTVMSFQWLSARL